MEFGVAGLRAAGYAMGLAGKLLRIYGFALAVYGVLFALLGFYFGLTGVGIATAAWSLINLAMVQRAIGKRLEN
jgi:O-antigen/teichoic acid export membrane protein